MRVLQWLISNGFIVLSIAITIVALYFSIWTYRTLEDNRAVILNADGTETSTRKRSRSRRRAKSVLVIAFVILGVASIAVSVWKTRTPIRWNPSNQSYKTTALVSQTITHGSNLRITLTRIVPLGGSSYQAEGTIEYKNEQTEPFSGVEGAIITFPKDDGYVIQVFKVNEQAATFLIAKN